MKKNGLKRGLDELFLDNSLPEDAENTPSAKLPIHMIDIRPDQPRKSFDQAALAELADSIAQNGVLQPILVRPVGDRYEIIAGERRFRASKMAGLSEIPAVTVTATDEEAARYALIENIQRSDLNPYEEAAAYRQLKDEYGLTQEAVALSVGKSRAAVANALRLLDLPDAVAAHLKDGTLSAGHARTLLGLKNPDRIEPVANVAIRRQLTVRQLEALVKNENRRPREKAETEPKVDYAAALENRVRSETGRQCRITHTAKKKMLEIEYRDNDDLSELLTKLFGADILE